MMISHAAIRCAWMLGCLLAPQSMAVIVGGTGGDGLGNASESGLQADLGSRALPAFPFWNNLLRVSDSSGIYLGRNSTTGRGWVMTATHVTPLTVGSSTITVAGQAYTVRDNKIIKHPDASGSLSTDIRLYAIGGNNGDPALPSLPAVPLQESDVTAGDHLILTGRGRRQQVPTEDTTTPYLWDGFTDSANQLTRQIRWGSNHVQIAAAVSPDLLFLLEEQTGTPPVIIKRTLSFACVFDDPADTGTPYEGQLALLDSGGGAFVKRNGSWYLAGTNYSVDDGSDADTYYNPCGYGDISEMTHLATYRGQIETITGPLEPAISGPQADLDGDGIANLLEYGLNLDPLTNEQVIMTPGSGLSGLPIIRIENHAGADRLTMEFVRRTASSGSGLTYIPQFSLDVTNWQSVGTVVSVTSIDSNWDRVKFADSATLSGAGKRFARLKIAVAD
jgi:hypothetical protein